MAIRFFNVHQPERKNDMNLEDARSRDRHKLLVIAIVLASLFGVWAYQEITGNNLAQVLGFA